MFDPEAPRPELRRRIAGKPGCDAPSARVAGPLPHPSQQRPGPAVKLSDPQDPRRRRARCHVTPPPPPPPKHRRNAGRRKAFAPARLGWPRRGRVPRARAGRGGRRAGLAAGPSAPQRLPRHRSGEPRRAGAPFSRPAGGVERAECPPRPQQVPGARPPRSRRAAHRPARASLPRAGPAPARPPARRSRSQALSPGLHLGSALPAPAPLPPHSPSFPPPAAAAAACAHLSCPSGRCRPST